MATAYETTWMRFSSLAAVTLCGAGYGYLLDDAHLAVLSGVMAGRLIGVIAAMAFVIALPTPPCSRRVAAM